MYKPKYFLIYDLNTFEKVKKKFKKNRVILINSLDINLNKIKSSLEIVAPFDGEVTNLGNLKEQQWLNEDTAILKLVDKNNYQVIAFVSEKNISSLDTNKEIWFTPSSTSQDSIAAHINSISKSPINNFDMYPMVTSIFDGPIAASENPSGGIRSEQAYYKVTLDLEDNTSTMNNKMLGFVNMGIESRSYFKRFIDFSSATLIRELNF